MLPERLLSRTPASLDCNRILLSCSRHLVSNFILFLNPEFAFRNSNFLGLCLEPNTSGLRPSLLYYTVY